MTPAEKRGVNAGQMAESGLTPAGMGDTDAGPSGAVSRAQAA